MNEALLTEMWETDIYGSIISSYKVRSLLAWHLEHITLVLLRIYQKVIIIIMLLISNNPDVILLMINNNLLLIIFVIYLPRLRTY